MRYRNKIKNRNSLELLLLLAFAVLFRLFLLKYQFEVGWDEANYLILARAFAQGNWQAALHPYWSPMFSVCIALFSFVFSDFALSARMVSLVAGVLVLLPVYFFAKEVFNHKIAIISAALLAVFPPIAFYSTSAWSESTYMAFSVFGIYFGWKTVKKKSVLQGFVTGILFGLAYLTKPEGIGYFAVYLAILLILLVVRPKRRKHFGSWALIPFYILGFVLMSAPYVLFLHQSTGQWTLSSKVLANQQFEANYYTDEAYDFNSLNSDNTQMPMDMIFHEGNFLELVHKQQQPTQSIGLGLLVKKYSKNLFQLLKKDIPALFGVILGILAVLGLFGKGWSKQAVPINGYLLSYVIFFWLCVVPLFHINDRYLLSGFVLCFVWMGKGVVLWFEWMTDVLKKLNSPKVQHYYKSLAIVFVASMIFLLGYLPETAKIVARDRGTDYFWAEAPELKKAGLWIRSQEKSSPVIMSYNKAVDYYSGCSDIKLSVSFPSNPIDRIVKYAINKNVDYIVVSQRYLTAFPNLAPFFQDEELPSDLILVYEDLEDTGLGVRIFQVQK